MNKDWLWDRKISLPEVKKILKDPLHENFVLFASLLLTRKNNPKEVFVEYVDPLVFCKNWPKIKKAMRKDKWNNKRVVFWQAIYENLIEGYRKKGISFRERKKVAVIDICRKVGEQIREIRKAEGLSQKELAKRIGVSQQLISRIEKGKENISLAALNNVLKALNKSIDFTFI